mmetsp:Transcript_18739/g.33913  ORF Transcript_18739/g.33913 Transcript_18739/m.33913 type:complete len:333 (-) Transcript_18739:88-1086(-)|eukprot:CAMPEP_0202496940 /NCGR_PEP_ID=MMETSP1361-20130828/21411_1 /ASSEMBLY_ACC=CAM_ASM_000849 /TAXON_ID=210615 /ORGANISM="Staurosira complex sp., Strain CCMP2646" /LENGTH=332 /DNA_ID=CAMNT_0049128393 /DNA_START=167 /DNA_END=1165 /DNA_ORIENTATION=-
MEEALLKEMVSERDKKIAQLRVAVDEHNAKLFAKQRELEKVQDESSEAKLQYRRAIASLVKKRDEGLHKIQKVEKEVRNQNGSLHVYADILKEAAPESVDSSYVVRMQAQLCKAMHSMGILEHQLAIVNSISSEVVKSQKEAITSVVDEKSAMELEVMNELMAIDDARREIEGECKAKLEKEQLKLVKLRAELGMNEERSDAGSDSENDDERSSSEEEDEYVLEMREGLGELKEAIAEMEDETAKQLDTIESLKAQLAKLQMSVDDDADTAQQENGHAESPTGEQDLPSAEQVKEDTSPKSENGESPTVDESDDDEGEPNCDESDTAQQAID